MIFDWHKLKFLFFFVNLGLSFDCFFFNSYFKEYILI